MTALEEDVARAKHFADHARAANTNRAYDADWKRFEAWCASHRKSAETANPAAVAAFLAWLPTQPRKKTDPGGPRIALPTVLRAYAGIAKRFRRAKALGWMDRGRPAEIADVIAGLQREITHVPVQKQAVTEKELRAMIAAIEPGPAGARDRALILVGFFGAFRRTALVALDVADVTFDTEGLKVRIRRDKTDQTGKGRTIGLLYVGAPTLCPVRALKAWLETAGITQGAIFRPFSRKRVVLDARLTPEMVAETVKRLAAAAGLDATRFAGHSLRAGFVTTARRKKKTLESIMRQTGHKRTDTVLGYIRQETIFEDNATEGLI